MQRNRILEYSKPLTAEPKLEAGRQVLYIPYEGCPESQWEFGFLADSRTVVDPEAFVPVRYWHKTDPLRMRTLDTAESTRVSDLLLFASRPYEYVARWVNWVRAKNLGNDPGEKPVPTNREIDVYRAYCSAFGLVSYDDALPE